MYIELKKKKECMCVQRIAVDILFPTGFSQNEIVCKINGTVNEIAEEVNSHHERKASQQSYQFVC